MSAVAAGAEWGKAEPCNAEFGMRNSEWKGETLALVPLRSKEFNILIKLRAKRATIRQYANRLTAKQMCRKAQPFANSYYANWLTAKNIRF